ncbi:MAG TPA: hypothetical protein PK867_17990, partial [Pirellulales bacterium]|nr:hypothetical protein [Pirellulales bacterium]
TAKVVWACLLAALTTAGCGRDKTPMARVEGRIKFDGKAIEKGNILFVPPDGMGPTAGGEITQAEFSVLVPPGTKRIEVRSPKLVGQRKASEGPASPTDRFEELIPPAYNENSALTKDIELPETRIDLHLTP